MRMRTQRWLEAECSKKQQMSSLPGSTRYLYTRIHREGTSEKLHPEPEPKKVTAIQNSDKSIRTEKEKKNSEIAFQFQEKTRNG